MSTRPGVNPRYLVRRKLAMVPPVASELALSRVRTLLGERVGFESLDWQPGTAQMVLAYDASKLDLASLLEVLEEQGWALAPRRWNRFKCSWFAFSDRNIQDNARDQSSSCCSQSPLRNR